jgi:hypothetical protein
MIIKINLNVAKQRRISLIIPAVCRRESNSSENGCPTNNIGHDGKTIVRSQLLVNFNIDTAIRLEGRFIKPLSLFIDKFYATNG